MSLTCKQLPLPDQARLYGNLISRLGDAAVFLMDEAGCILSWNPGVQRILGFKEDEWVGQSVQIVFTPEDRARGESEAEIEAALRNGQSADVRWHLRRDGTGFFAEGSLVALRDDNGQFLGFAKVMRDVTRRKERELALKDALAYAESVVNTMREPLLVLDADFRVRSANRSFYQVFGLKREVVENHRLYEIADREWDLPELHKLLEENLQEQESVEDFELEHDFPRIGSKVMLLNGRKLWREGSKTEFLLLAFEDITERKRSERELKENERRQAALLAIGDHMRDAGDIQSLIAGAMKIAVSTLRASRAGYGRFDSSGEYVTVEGDWGDGSVPTMVGRYRLEDYGPEFAAKFKRGDLISIPDVRTHPTTANAFHPWDALQVRAVIAVPLMEHGRCSAMLFIHSSTPRTWTESDLAFLRKAVDRIWSAAERERALQELKRSEEFTRSILASSPDYVTVMDLDGRIMSTDEGGCGPVDVDGVDASPHEFWAQAWGDNRDKAEAAIAGATEGRTTRFEGFCSTVRRVPRWWEVVVAPINDGGPRPVRILSLARDITERKRAEQERERLTGELKRSNEELLHFAHIVAHDLQSPLRGVSGFAQLVQRNARERLSEDDGELLEGIAESAHRMQRLVESLLRYAQVGNGEIERAPVDMNEVVDAALRSLQVQLQEKRAEIVRDTNLPSVTGDSVQLVQLMQNLIGNALKYSRADLRTEVRVSFVQKNGDFVFSVADNGEGISPEHQARIFEPLKRLHGSEIPGTGLGLALCERIVKRHGGRIWVDSQVNVGSTFYFRLPGA
ncbi:MAG: PAS domain S-box protein [Bryobacteraceae bacterium]